MSIEDVLPETAALAEVAERLGSTIEALKKAARRGEFPPLLRISARNYRVRVDELSEWLAGRWETPESAATRRDVGRAAIRQPPNRRTSRASRRREPAGR